MKFSFSQAVQQIEGELKQQGCELLSVKQFLREDDKNLFIVLAKRDHKMHPFVTWTYNICSGLYWGHYLSSMAEAEADFQDRCKDR